MLPNDYLERLEEHLVHATAKAAEKSGTDEWYSYGFWWGMKSNLESIISDFKNYAKIEKENAMNSQFRALAN